MNKTEALNKLNSFSKLQFNWDGYNAQPITVTIINKTKQILELLNYKYLYVIAPFSAGILIELKQDNKEIEVFVFSTKYHLHIIPNLDDSNTWYELDNLSKQQVVSEVNKFFN